MTHEATPDRDAGPASTADPDAGMGGGTDDDPANGSGRGDRPDDEPGVPDPDEVLDRRTLVKALIALAFGIPLLVEGLTFLGLLESRLLGDEDGDATGTGTADPGGVAVGDDLLAGTPQSETVESMGVDPGEDAWAFSMSVLVENPTDAGGRYQFRLTSVTGAEGTSVSNPVGTDRLDPGESERISGSWELPAGERPETVRAVGITVPEDGSATTTAEDVELGGVPVRR